MLAPGVSYAGAWQRKADYWIYKEGTTRTTGWMREPGDSWYHFTSEGIMETGWYQDEQNDRYYLNRASDGIEGQMRTGWFQENEIWYFLNTVHDGFFGRAMANRWQWIDGYCYRFDENGAMYADCITPDGYIVNSDGRWTVNGVVQYEEGKGIITRPNVGSERNSDGSGGSSNSGGSNRPSGGEDKPGEEDKPGGEDKPDEGDEPSDEGAGNITIRYMVQDTGEILYQKEVSDKIGELYVIQYPAIEGYKLLPDQRESAYFQTDPQVISVYYRAIQSGETPDESKNWRRS